MDLAGRPVCKSASSCGRAVLSGVESPGAGPALDAAAAAKPARQEVQLGAWRSEAEAQTGWRRAVARSAGALDGLAPHIVTADLPGKGRFYRLRTATSDPAGLCASLQAAGQDCLRARD